MESKDGPPASACQLSASN